MSLTDVETSIDRIRDRASDTIDSYKSAATALKDDPSRTDAYKRENGHELYSKAVADLQDLLQQEYAALDQGIEDRKQRLFGNRAPLTGMDAIAQRDADERVQGIRTETEAANMMERALQNKDDILARSLYMQAITYGLQGAADQYAAKHADAGGLLTEIATLQSQRTMQNDLQRQFFYGAISPLY